MTNVILASVFTLVGSLGSFVVGLVVEYLLRSGESYAARSMHGLEAATGADRVPLVRGPVLQQQGREHRPVGPGGRVLRGGKPIDALPVKDAQGTNPPVGPIDLPSRHSVYIPMIVEADGELLKKLKGSDRGRFVVPLGKLACSCALDCGGLCCVSSGDTTDRTALKGALRWRTSENSVKAKFSHKVHIPVGVG